MNLEIRKIVVWAISIVFLVGVASAAHDKVLCIDHEGQIEIGKYGFLCCSDSEDPCKTENTNNQNNDHKNCSNCVDLELDGMFWSGSRPTLNKGPIEKTTFLSIMDLDISFTRFSGISSSITTFPQVGGQGPPSSFIASTVLRC